MGSLQVVAQLWATPDVTQPVLTPFYKQRSEFFLGFGSGLGLQRHPFNRFAPGIVFDGDPGHELAIASPKAANCVLAVVQNLGVSISP
jgi:hypothetical protein